MHLIQATEQKEDSFFEICNVYSLSAFHIKNKHMKTTDSFRICLRILVLMFLISSCEKEEETGTVTDMDGNVYYTIKIGSQVWMTENLKVTHYRNGDAILNVTSDSGWAKLTTGAYCSYSNNYMYAQTYGYLYNYYAVSDSRNICPEGWHIPTKDEWITLSNYLKDNDGGKMKEKGTEHWLSPNTAATNESGFTGLPGGSRGDIIYNGAFYGLGNYGDWWTSTINTEETSSELSFYWSLSNGTGYAYLGNIGTWATGYSVRCIKD